MAMQSRQLLNAFSSLMMRFCSLQWPYCCAQLPIDFLSLCDISMRSDNLPERARSSPVIPCHSPQLRSLKRLLGSLKGMFSLTVKLFDSVT